ncbi:MAG: phosphoribosylformylglycinamidine synthase subunit PurS [Alphaproteobacteria bacterium]|nr:phosphoribosylformylglycinamidine synthase subunit PurS [Alphaproteobacteria bacterium]MCB1551399.1 phosphoribosylformylglycinamidine synthase subunit PurS [Alphaproteobacteria bacterium]MCB9984290.1 phosphoribosylformylglycinamidine synthase subunit PurS [Micavibrio sp.]HPQ50441.1 phosphoribosylformylglycinamidine synthase subunit PurS [Alphaproteobacteria bacterium]HRK97134.1 phosphoribosylformylglycinamidine synthase subunit PurS [Alphaproteobacteria bacterium]
MKAIVKVTLRKGVLDPQGKAIESALHHLGFEEVGDVRQGKFIEIDVPEGTSDERVKEMCQKLLANPVTEDFEVVMAA